MESESESDDNVPISQLRCQKYAVGDPVEADGKGAASDNEAVAASPLLAVGTQVEVTNCQGEGQWSGIVVEVNAEARSYAIKYDDDHYESDVEAERVREEYAASPAQKKPCFGPSETLEAVESRFLGATLPAQ